MSRDWFVCMCAQDHKHRTPAGSSFYVRGHIYVKIARSIPSLLIVVMLMRHLLDSAHRLLLRQELLRTCREAEAASLGLDTSRQTADALSVHAPLAVAAWKGKGSINILVSKGTALLTLAVWCLPHFPCAML